MKKYTINFLKPLFLVFVFLFTLSSVFFTFSNEVLASTCPTNQEASCDGPLDFRGNPTPQCINGVDISCSYGCAYVSTDTAFCPTRAPSNLDCYNYRCRIGGCTIPGSSNYNPSAEVDDGSCIPPVSSTAVNLNFLVKNASYGNSPIGGASVSISHDYGNGTSRTTDGGGFTNFGVDKNTNDNYTVTASNCTTVNGTTNVGTTDKTITVNMTCSGPSSGGGGSPGCTDPAAYNYNAGATSNDGSCNYAAVGEIELANCTHITGIAADPDNLAQPVNVYVVMDNDFYKGGVYTGAWTVANIFRNDPFITKYGYSGNYGFDIPTPAILKDGLTHKIYVHPLDFNGTGPNRAIAGSGAFTVTCPVPTTVPVVSNVSLSNYQPIPNGTTQYNVTVVATDSGGASKINQLYSLLTTSDGSTNATYYRGYLTWGAGDNWPGEKDHKQCDGNGDGVPDLAGGFAVIQSLGGNSIYGHSYIELDSCATSITGANNEIRNVTFKIRLNPTYTTTLTGNHALGLAYNTDSNVSTPAWGVSSFPYSLSMPSISSATISPVPVSANGSTQYTISVVGSDPSGGTNIASQRTLINTAGPYRGYVGWSNSTWGGVQKDEKSCSGGGFGAILITAGSYGDQYLNLVSCSTSVSGNTRTTNFVVTFTPLFTTPTTGNIVSGWLQNLFSHIANWTAGQSFDLNVPIPGQCGTADGKTYASTVTAYAPDTQCTAGTPSTTAFPAQGTTQPWTCSGVNGGPSSPQCSASRNLPGAPVVTLSASPTSVTSGNSSTLTWTVTGSVTSCTASGDWSGAKSTSGGSQSTGALASTKTYNLSCTGPGGTGIAPPVTVTVGAATFSVSVTANPGPGGSIRSSEAPVPVIDTKVCGNPCTKNYTVGSTVTLKAIPNSSYWKFTSWVGGSCDSQSGDTCDINVSSNRSATAIFTPRLFIYREF